MIVVIRTKPFFCITSGKDMVVNLQKHVMILKLYCIVLVFFKSEGVYNVFLSSKGTQVAFFTFFYRNSQRLPAPALVRLPTRGDLEEGW